MKLGRHYKAGLYFFVYHVSIESVNHFPVHTHAFLFPLNFVGLSSLLPNLSSWILFSLWIYVFFKTL